MFDAGITGFEPVPHGVTSRYCQPFNHTPIVVPTRLELVTPILSGWCIYQLS